MRTLLSLTLVLVGCMVVPQQPQTTGPTAAVPTASEAKKWTARPVVGTLDGFDRESHTDPKRLADAFAAADDTMRVSLRDGAKVTEVAPSLEYGRAPSATEPGELPCRAVVSESGLGLVIENGKHDVKPFTAGESALLWEGSMSGPGRFAILVTANGRIYYADPWDLVPAKQGVTVQATCWIPGPIGRDRMWEAIAPSEFHAYAAARQAHNNCVDRVFGPIKAKVTKMGKEIVVKDGKLWVYRDDYLQVLVTEGFQRQQRACKQDQARARKTIAVMLAKWEAHVNAELSRIH